MKIYKSKDNQKGITLIALVVTIVVLLILAGISISMLTGESGIISQAQKAKEQTEIGKEKEIINIAFTSVKGAKISRGDMSDVTSAELQEEINNYTNEATVTGTGLLKITYTSGREYDIDQNGNIIKTESYDGMYSVGDLEGKIAPEDLFEYEIIDEQSKTARILRIKAEYCNIEGYNFTTDEYNVADTNGDIIYKGEKISDMLVIPYEVTINGTKYLIKEANISAGRREIVSGAIDYYMTLPNVKWIVYPNTIEKMEYYESRDQGWNNDYNRYSIVEDITFSDNIKTIGAMLNNTQWYENQPDGDLYIEKVYYEYKGEMPEDTNIIIKEGTTAIADEAFSNYRNLISITIPDSVTSIGNSAFCKCSSLTSITIPDSVTSIENHAFYYCENLTSITIPDSVTSIGDWTFDGCSSLTSITIPNSVTSIGNGAFSHCTGLTSITIPDSVTSIGGHAFSWCTNLTNITIPNSVTSIESYAFIETPWYKNKPDGDVYIGKVYYKYNGEMPENTNIIIKEGTTAIAEDAFSWCTNLTSITIPDSVTSIGDGAFSDCTGLTSITIPDSVTSIGSSAFRWCTSLTSINIKKEENSISGAPWGASNATVNWNYTGE